MDTATSRFLLTRTPGSPDQEHYAVRVVAAAGAGRAAYAWASFQLVHESDRLRVSDLSVEHAQLQANLLDASPVSPAMRTLLDWLEQRVLDQGLDWLVISASDPFLQTILPHAGYLPRGPALGYTRHVRPLPAQWYSCLADTRQREPRVVEPATLLFVSRLSQVLVMHKLRGHGAGLVNGPGGKMEAGETAMTCIIREAYEELAILPQDITLAGRLRFYEVDGLLIDGYIFRAEGLRGVPQRSDEGDPFWVSQDELPYERMWPDDRLWLPQLLRGEWFSYALLTHGQDVLDIASTLDQE